MNPEHSFDLDSFVLPDDGEIFFARWRHPGEERKVFTQAGVDALRYFLKYGDVAIDIGAHTGDTTLPIALAVGHAGIVLALEPNPVTFKVLIANAGLNRKKTNIIPLMFAAMDRDGDFEFHYSDEGFCNGGLFEGVSESVHRHPFKLRVKGKNLMNYLATEFPREISRVRYIKIDTEGYDNSVVDSIRPLLITNHPYIRSEIHGHMSLDAREKYLSDLNQIGYRVRKFNSDTDYRGEELTLSRMSNWKQFDIFAEPE